MIALKQKIYELESKGVDMKKARVLYNLLAVAGGGQKKERKIILPAFSYGKTCIYFDPLYSRFDYDFL